MEDPVVPEQSVDEKLRQMEEKISTYFRQQLGYLKERVENLERSVRPNNILDYLL